MSLKFRTKVSCVYSQHKPVYCNAGNPEVDVYDSKYDENGDLVVFKSGKSNLQDYINSFAAACDINNIVARYMLGEIPDFNFVDGAYMDITNMPTTYAEMVNKVKEGEELFNGLPTDVREKFGNDPVKFFAQYGSKEFFDTLGISSSSDPDDFVVEKEGEKVNEQKSNE